MTHPLIAGTQSHPLTLTDSLDKHMNSPLHVASGKGHTAIIIALVEEGGADVNSKGGERNDTPLMLTVSHTHLLLHVLGCSLHMHPLIQARAGHSEAARYLLAKGADVTAVDDNGDSALSVAATNSMVTLLRGEHTVLCSAVLTVVLMVATNLHELLCLLIGFSCTLSCLHHFALICTLTPDLFNPCRGVDGADSQ